MSSFDECFQKVKTDCFKFISSQETKTEKFKNKSRMIRSFLIPICFWISKKASKKKPLIIGLAGGQGIGKTTISSIITIILKKYFKLNTFKILSISHKSSETLFLFHLWNLYTSCDAKQSKHVWN